MEIAMKKIKLVLGIIIAFIIHNFQKMPKI